MKNAEQQIKPYLNLFKGSGYYWIAGGSIMSFLMDEEPNDIDFYFENEGALNKAIAVLKKRGFRIVEDLDFGKKLVRKGTEYDLMYTQKTPQECISNFDISVCCAAIDSNGIFYHHDKYFDHVGEKQLYYIGNSPNLNWLNKSLRLRKYLKKGFEINQKNLIFWLNKQESDQKMLWKKIRNGLPKEERGRVPPANQKKIKIVEKKLNL